MKEIKIQKDINGYEKHYKYNKKYEHLTIEDIKVLPVLYDAYNKPSDIKWKAYHDLRSQFFDNGGECGAYGILSYNTFSFTFVYCIDNIVYIDTPNNCYWCYLKK